MGNNLKKGLVKFGKWSVAALFVTLITFFLGQYVMQVLATHTATVWVHDTADGTIGDRLYASGTVAAKLNVSITAGANLETFSISVPPAWSINETDGVQTAGLGGLTCACDATNANGTANSCYDGVSYGDTLRCTGLTAANGHITIDIRTPATSNSQRSSEWNWTANVSSSDISRGTVYTLALDNGDVGFDIRQASNNNLPQTGAQVTLILTNNTNSTTLLNDTEVGRTGLKHDGLFIWESGQLPNSLFLAGSLQNYSWTVSRGTDFLRAPAKFVAYSTSSANQQRIFMNNSAGLHIGVLDELNVSRTWGEITISLYNLSYDISADGAGAPCSDSYLLFRNTTPSGRNYVNITLDPTLTIGRVLVQVNKSGYVKAPCVALNVSSANVNATNITFAGQASDTARPAANCSTTRPTIDGGYSTCGGLNFTIRVSAENQFGGSLPLAATNSSFIAYDTGTDDALWPNFAFQPTGYLSGVAYLNLSGTGVFAINRTGYVITNFTNTNSTNDDRQQILVYEDGASVVQNYIAGPALNYTIKVFGYNELNLGAFGTGSTDVFNGQIGVNRTSVTYATEISFGSNNDTYIAANATGAVPLSGINISLARTGFVNRTVVVTPNPFNITEVWFGNGSGTNTCGDTTGANSTNIYNCTSPLLYVLKVRIMSEFGVNIPGFQLYVNSTGGTPAQNNTQIAFDGGTNDANSTADGFLYWAINATNYTSTPTSGNLNPVYINATPGGFLETNTTIGQYINDSTQLSLVLRANYTVLVRTISQNMIELSGTEVNNVTWNTSLGGGSVGGNIIECTQNLTNRQFWGCNATSNVVNNISFPIYVNTSAASGYMNGTNTSVPANLPARYTAIAAVNATNITLNYTVLAVATDELGFLIYSAAVDTNVTNVTYQTSGDGVNCFKNATNTSVWGCPVSLSAGLRNISFNVTNAAGFLNSSNATTFSLPSNTNATQTTVLGQILYTVRVRTLDNFANVIENPTVTANVTNVTYRNNTSPGTTIYCTKNTTATQFWFCPVPVNLEYGNITANVTGTSGYMDYNITPMQIPPTTAVGNQTRVDTSNNFTVMLITRNEFEQLIYSGATANITNVTWFNTTTQFTCLRNSTAAFSYSWGCRIGIGGTNAANASIQFNLTTGSTYLSYALLNTTGPPAGTGGLPTVNRSLNTFTILVTTLNEFNATINGTGMSVNVQNATGTSAVACFQNVTNGSIWGCPIVNGSSSVPVSATAPGYLNYSTGNVGPPQELHGAQTTTTTFNNYTFRLTTNDEFNNPVININTTGLLRNVTDVTYRNSTGTIACTLNTTNTSNWGCAIPVGFGAGSIEVNVSAQSGYLNGSNSTAYTLPASVTDQQTRNQTLLRHTILVITRSEFYTNFTIGNVTNVTFNPTNYSARPCVNGSTNPQEWGCRAHQSDISAVVYVNTSAQSGYRNFSTESVSAPSAAGSLMPYVVNATNQFNVNVTTGDELGVNFRDAQSVQFYNGSTQILCIKNATNTSVWGCPGPIGTSFAGNINVTDARFVNYTSSEITLPDHSLAPARLISANQYTLRIWVNDSANVANIFTDARVTVKNGTNDAVVYDYQAANVTSGNKTGAYLFAVNSTQYPGVYVDVSRPGYDSYVDYNTSTGVKNNITIRTAIASGAAVTRTILLGVVAPSTPTHVSPPDNFVTSDSTPEFVWTNVTGATGFKYEFQVDDNTNFTSPTYSINVTNTSVTPTSALADGSYAWRVRSLDINNNTNGFSGARTLTVDATAPAASTIVSPVNLQNVSGVSVINITASDATAGIAAVEVWRNNTLLANLTSSPYQYNWITTSEPNEPFALVARAIDKAGNTLNSSTINVTVDNLPGAPVITRPTAGQNLTGTVTVDVVVNEGNVQKVDLLVDGAVALTNTTPASTTSFGWNSLAVADGSHTLSAKVTDYANNTNTSLGVTVTIDNIAPQSVEITSPANNSFVSGQITIIASVADTVAIQAVQFFDNGTQIGSNDTSAPWTVAWNTANANDAVHEINARVYDRTNNVLNSTTLRITVDNTAPTASVTSPTAQQNKTSSAVIDVTYSYTETNPSSIILEVYNTSSVAGRTTISTSLTGGSTISRTDSITLNSSVTQSWYGINITVLDKVSQRGATTQTAVILVDNTAPAASISAPTAGQTLKGTVIVTTSVSDTGLSGINRTEFLVDGSVLLTNSSQANNAQFTWDTTTTVDGGHTLTIKAYDWSGNVRTSDAVNVTVDNAAPQAIVITSPTNNSFVTTTINIEASVSDAIAVQTVQFYDNNTQIGSNDTSAPWTASWNTANANDGLHNISAWVYDNANNRLIATNLTVTVDNTVPTAAITLPTVQQNKTNSGVVTLTYSYTETNPSSIILEIYNTSSVAGTTTISSGVTGGTLVNRTDTITLNSSVGEQFYGINVTVVDKVSQRGTATSTAIVLVDNTGPTASISSPAAAAYVNGTISITTSVTDSGSGVNRTDLYIDGVFLNTTTGTNPSFPWQTQNFSDGVHTLILKAYDWTGNVRETGFLNVTVDNTVPVAIVVAPANSSVTGINTRLDVTTNEIAECSYVLDNINNAAFTVMSSSNSTVHSQNLANLAGGAHTVRVRCIDPVGARSSNVTTTWTVDTSGPQVGAVGVSTTTTNSSVTVNTTISYSGPLGNITSANFWNKTFGTLPVPSDPGNSSFDVISANGLFDSTQEDVGTRVDLSTLANGDYWICIRGNVSGSTQGPAGCSARVQLDRTAPKATVTTPDNGTTQTTTTPTITFRVLDEVGGTGINVSSITVFNFSSTGTQSNTNNLNFNPSDNCTSTNGIYEYSCSFTPNASLSSGVRHNISVTVRDKAGNAVVNTSNFTVNTANTITASLVEIIRSTAVANNSYEGGWQFRFNITTGSGGNAVRMKMANWTLVGDSSTTIQIFDNVRMNYTDSSGNARTFNVSNSYNETQTIFALQDVESGTTGTQGNVTVFIKIPTGTQAGSYTTSYGFGLYNV